MKWRGRRQSANVEDRRGMRPGGKTTLGCGGILIVIVLALVFNQNPLQILESVNEVVPPARTETMYVPSAGEEELADFVSVVLADTEDVWNRVFGLRGSEYREPVLVLFSGAVNSACGMANAATGPFYCPGDEKLYIDLSFYGELKDRFGAPGDFAMAYVVAHEVGHHVQNLMGFTDQVHRRRSTLSQTDYNKLSVRLELQADFLAGMWAHYAESMFNSLEEGDIEEALNAANAIGDDRLQRQSQGRVVPDAFTHGTSEQRMRWFRKGYEAGDLSQGDTFSATVL